MWNAACRLRGKFGNGGKLDETFAYTLSKYKVEFGNGLGSPRTSKIGMFDEEVDDRWGMHSRGCQTQIGAQTSDQQTRAEEIKGIKTDEKLSHSPSNEHLILSFGQNGPRMACVGFGSTYASCQARNQEEQRDPGRRRADRSEEDTPQELPVVVNSMHQEMDGETHGRYSRSHMDN